MACLKQVKRLKNCSVAGEKLKLAAVMRSQLQRMANTKLQRMANTIAELQFAHHDLQVANAIAIHFWLHMGQHLIDLGSGNASSRVLQFAIVSLVMRKFAQI